MTVTIRGALPADTQRIVELNRSALGYTVDPQALQTQLERILLRPTDRLLVAADAQSGRVEGFVHAADYETLHSGRLKNIVALAVDPAKQGQGLGRMLLEAVEHWAREEGCDGVRLVSGMQRTQAHAFYTHCGYTMRKEQKNFIRYF